MKTFDEILKDSQMVVYLSRGIKISSPGQLRIIGLFDNFEKILENVGTENQNFRFANYLLAFVDRYTQAIER